MVGGYSLNRARSAWWAVGALLTGVVVFVVYSFIGTLVFGIFIYYGTRPIYRRVCRKVRPPSLAAFVSLVGLALPGILLFTYALAIGLQEASRFIRTTDVGPYETMLQPYLDLSGAVEHPGSLLGNADTVASIQAALESTITYVGIVGTGLLHLFVMFAIAFYLLRDGHRLSRWFRNRFSDDRGILEAYLESVDRDFDNIFFGNLLNAIMTGAIGAITYSVLDFFAPAGNTIPYPALTGLLAGAASLIPVVGMKLVYFPMAAYLAAVGFGVGSLGFAGVFFLVSLVVVDTIPDLVLRPYVSGRSLHVGMVMFAYIFGPLLFGWYGIFLGPMLLVLVVHFARLVMPALIDGEHIRPYTVDPTHLTEPAAPESGPGPGPEPASETPDGGTDHSSGSPSRGQ